MNECPPALLEYQNLKLPKPLGKSSGQSSKKSTVSGCTRCGRKSHKIQNCYAKTSLDGSCLEPLGDSQSCTDGDASSSSGEDVDDCFRCGRPGHFRSACYAKTDINGYFL